MIEVHRWLHGQPWRTVDDAGARRTRARSGARIASTHVLAELRGHMVAAADLRVPLNVDVGVGRNWDEAH